MVFFRTKVFRRVFLMYSTIIVVTLFCLSAFVTNNIKRTIINNQIYLNQRMIENVNDYFKQQNETSKVLIDSLYKKQIEFWDTIDYLTCDYENYVKNRLDNYCNVNSFYYPGINSFARSCFDYNTNIENVIFYSSKNDKITIHNKYGNNKYISEAGEKIGYVVGEDRLADSFIMLLDGVEQNESEKYYYTFNNIKNPYRLNNVGLFIIKYNLDRIDRIVNSYEKAKNYIIAIDKSGKVVYDSSNRYTNRLYPYLDRLQTTSKPVQLDKLSYISIATSKFGVMVVGILPVEGILSGNKIIIYMIYALSLVLLIIAEMLTYLKIEELSKRTEGIINAMKDVQNGNFKTRIKSSDEDDEIALIADSFNDMCTRLEDYINKVYLAEIKQKNAEMRALQNQINPHFLYNTLESIRMKAISNGDREVGRMLYNLAALFRNMVKGKTLITIDQEIANCKLYLELFKFRYDGRFDYCIDVDDEILSKGIIKFTIQPVIENFIVHGVRLEDDDNFIMVIVKKDGSDIVICVEDNGKGISPEKIKLLNERMEKLDTSESLGLTNVHERIRTLYGEGYGVTVNNRKTGGTVVSIKIPIKEVDADV